MVDSKASQRSFTAGELDPSLHGRRDFARYQVGLKTLRNGQVHASGGVSNRAGLRFVTEVKDSTKHVRLQKFEAAADDAYLLESGNLYIRPIFRGAYVDSGGGIPVEIVTPYTAADVDGVYIEQSNDIASLASKSFAPRELARSAPLVWSLSTISFVPGISAPTGLTATGTNAYTGYGADHVPRAYKYVVAAVAASGEESLPSTFATNATLVVLGFDANFVTLGWTAVGGATEYVVYKEENGVYGFIGSTPNVSFVDRNIEPSFATGPQTGNNPFGATDDYPGQVTFMQGRRMWAATNNKPQTIFGSQSGNFKNMGTSTPVRDDDALEFTLAAKRKQDIFHMVPLERGMIVFTRSGEWRVTGSLDAPITPSSILPEPQTYYGSSATLAPLVVGQELLFATRSARVIRNMEYSLQVDKYVSSDLTLLAKHLFKGRFVVAWDYAGEPDGVIWCVMSDGELLSLTYLREEQVWGWGRHHTAGKFLDVKVIPEDTRDVPYFLIQRQIDGTSRQYIEFLEDRNYGEEIEDAFFVDAGLRLNNPVSITSISTGAVTTITRAAHGLTNGDQLSVDDVGFIDDLGDTVTFHGRYYVASTTTNTFVLVDKNGDDIDTSKYSGLLYDLAGVYRKAFNTVTGLLHLKGRMVVALCDGGVVENLTVSNTGTLTLPNKYARITVGLRYETEIETLDILNPTGDDTGLQKSTARVFLRVQDTRGISVGANADTVEELPSRSYEDYGEPASLKGGLLEVPLWSSWGMEQPVTVKQTYPLPMTLLGVTNDLNYGGPA